MYYTNFNKIGILNWITNKYRWIFELGKLELLKLFKIYIGISREGENEVHGISRKFSAEEEQCLNI